MRNHTDTQLVSDFEVSGPVTWRRWPRPEVIEAGAALFHEGESARDVFWVLDGLIKLTGAHPGVCGRTLGLRRGRSLLGPYMPQHPAEHPCSAIAVARTRVFRFAANDFRERLADPAFMESARPAMSQALQADLEDYTRGFMRNPEQRLAALLSNFVQETVATGECVQVALPRGIDTTDLAALLRVTSAEMIDLLAGWGQRGFARHEQEGFTFCWTSLNGAVRRNSARTIKARSDDPFARRPVRSEARESSVTPGVTSPEVTTSSLAANVSISNASLANASGKADVGASADGPPRLPDPRIIKALTLIDNGYSRDDFELGDLGRELRMPAWHLARLLKTATGKTFGQLRNVVRVERARVALLTTELSVKEIAAGVGYTHPTDLTRHFRAVHALSPIAYRANARQSHDMQPLRSAMPLIATAMKHQA
jgi:AraC-like DNA-binding protein/CRP-like cAMP-binding protein